MEGNQRVPTARTKGLVIEALPDEVLVYDLDRHHASCLNQTAALVWKHCDGKRTVAQTARLLGKELRAPVDEWVVWYALDQLAKFDLLEERVILPPDLSPDLSPLSRQQFLRKIGIAAAIAVPIIVSIVVPTPMQAASCKASGQSCTSGAQCCSGVCSALFACA